MNANAGIKVDKATFSRFIERQTEGHFEYDRGRIVQHMTGGSFNHAQIVNDFNFVLRGLLSRRDWVVTGQNRGVDTGETVRYPDVLVEPVGGAGKEQWTTTPTLIVEVLSPSTAEFDLAVKPAAYMGLATLEAYIVASQDRAECQVWQRPADGRFPEAPEMISGRDSVIRIDHLGLAIPLGDTHQGIAST